MAIIDPERLTKIAQSHNLGYTCVVSCVVCELLTALAESQANRLLTVASAEYEVNTLQKRYDDLAHAVWNQNLEEDGQTVAGTVLSLQRRVEALEPIVQRTLTFIDRVNAHLLWDTNEAAELAMDSRAALRDGGTVK